MLLGYRHNYKRFDVLLEYYILLLVYYYYVLLLMYYYYIRIFMLHHPNQTQPKLAHTTHDIYIGKLRLIYIFCKFLKIV